MKANNTGSCSFSGIARCLIILPFCLFLLRVSPVENREFTLGFLVPYNVCKRIGNSYHCGKMYASAITVALDKINSDPHLLSGHNMTYIWSDTRCDQTTAVKQQLRQLREGVDAFIGPGCDCDTAAVVAEATDKPMISYECASFSIRKQDWPKTFLRTIGSVEEHLTPSILSLLQRFNWTKVGIVYENREKYIQLKDHLVSKLRKQSAIKYDVRFHDKDLPRDYMNIKNASVREKFKNIKNESKVLIFVTSVSVARPTIFWLRETGLAFNDTVFIMCGTNPIELSYFNRISDHVHGLLKDYTDVGSNGNPSSENTKRLLRHLDSVFMIAARSPRGREYERFASQVKARIKEAPFFSTKYDGYKDTPPPVQAASLYDAVNLYAIGLNMTLAQEKPLTGLNITDNIKSLRKFKSIRGFDMILDNQGSAQYDLQLYQIRNTKNISRVFLPIGTFMLESSEESSTTSSGLNLDGQGHVIWPNGGTEPPKDEPECGWSGVCPTVEPTKNTPGTPQDLTKIIVAVVSVMFVLLLLLFFVFMRHYRLEKELKSQLWKVRFSDLSFHFRQDSTSVHPHQTINGGEFNFDGCDKAKWTAMAQYKSVGEQVVVSRFPARRISLSRSDHIDLKRMRDLRHKNLNPFVGACTESPNVCIVMHYCSRGSLQECLENRSVSMDHLFITSLVTDIVKGMVFLHSSEIRSHGNLKSSNCLIDSHWILKITDYGLPAFRSKAMKNNNFAENPADLLWTAPEILRMPIRPFEGTQKGDVYSFAIILQEFHTREGPFSANKSYKHKEIVHRVKDIEAPPFRPSVPNRIEKDENGELYKLMTDCWDEEPNLRPDFYEISKSLHKIITNRGYKTNIVDNMVYMLSKYSDDLEGIVQERTELLLEEQKKTEALLEQMLPRPVAEQLKRNGNVEAESFNEVTIYFSDIVGFTSLSAESTPMQVVSMLNDLYLMCDDIIREYDVYKVETIGDAYMVVSGLPIQNGQKHASEISRMALHLLAAVKSEFVVKHKPDYQLKLRIGIHSGPVVAGVVGSMMPRYCLFGDTVNMASRMESTGEALRIHVSQETKEILNNLGGFTLESRGEVEIKGKGKVETYWLTHARNLRSSVTTRNDDGGYLRKRSLLAHQKLGSLKRSLKGRMSPGMPRKLTLLDDQEKHQENHGHENPLHCEIIIQENSLAPVGNRKKLKENGIAQEKQGLLSTMATTSL